MSYGDMICKGHSCSLLGIRNCNCCCLYRIWVGKGILRCWRQSWVLEPHHERHQFLFLVITPKNRKVFTGLLPKDLFAPPKLKLWKQSMILACLNPLFDLQLIQFGHFISDSLFSLNFCFLASVTLRRCGSSNWN